MTKKDVHASPAKTSSTTTVVTSTENGAAQNKVSAKQPPAKSTTKSTTSTTTRRLSLFALLMVAWFMMSGWIHVVLEGVWLANHQHVPSAVDFFASLSNFPKAYLHNVKNLASFDGIKTVLTRVVLALWKEYSFSDTRYADSNPLVLSLESISVLVVGPLCFVAAFAIWNQTSSRYALQLLVSICHLYGTGIYFGSEHFEHYIHVDVVSAKLFWVYYVVSNGVWVVVPTFAALNAFFHITSQFAGSSRAPSFFSFIAFLVLAPIIATLFAALFIVALLIAAGVLAKDPAIVKLLKL